ncbi:GIY-YIG nuclease family protein [Candidatus Nomurabacteria bacterium]|nr:MAG: GIY-YIG nuclease family protein [Candidatus Nomurabacteria bacterium]
MKISDLKKLKIPNTPGCYFFRDSKGILYIGKATSLRSRVRSYFGKDVINTRGSHIVDMVFKARTLTFQETESVLEALILEANLIKKYKPYYNTKEKDDKSWNYVCITDEELPKVIIERGKNIDFKNLKTENNKLKSIYGPYTNGSALKEALKIVRRIFPFIDNSSIHKDKYEFYRQLGLTPDMANKEVSKEYKKTIKNLELFFSGKKAQIILNLKKEMLAYAKKREFEKAGEIKKTIFALEHIHDVSLIKNENIEEGRINKFRIEAYDIAHMSGKNMVGVMTVVENGLPIKSEYKKFIIRTQSNANDTGALEEVLSRRFRHTEWGVPDLVVLDGGIAQLNVGKQVLKRYQFKIPIVSVVKNEKHKAKDILGEKENIKGNETGIVLANSEAHRFSITFHKLRRGNAFLGK